MESHQRFSNLNRSHHVSIAVEAKKISDILRQVAEELDESNQSIINVPSQIGQLFDVNGVQLCLCLLDESRMAAAHVSNDLLSALSRRQQQILTELVEGNSAKTIAEHLGIHPRTVEAHIHRIYRKTGTRGVAQLMAIVFAQL